MQPKVTCVDHDVGNMRERFFFFCSATITADFLCRIKGKLLDFYKIPNGNRETLSREAD